MQNEKASAEQIDLLIQAGLIDPSSIYNNTDSNKTKVPEELHNFYLQQTQGNSSNALMSESEWNKLKSSGSAEPAVSEYDTYEEYKNALAAYNMEQLLNNSLY